MNRIQIQKLLSINGYWSINKHLAKLFGFTATALLQQLIELQCEFFPNGDFYQQQDELSKKLGISEKVLVSARKKLVEAEVLIARRGHGAKYYYTIVFDNISKLFESIPEETEIFEGAPMESSEVTKGTIRKGQNVSANRKKRKQKEIIHEEVSDGKPSDDERLTKIKNLYWKKLVPEYPTNRLGNKQHGLEKWLLLEDKEMVLAIKNLNRYLKSSNKFVKNLQNYLTEKCFTEKWLIAQEEVNKKPNNKPDTKTISTEF